MRDSGLNQTTMFQFHKVRLKAYRIYQRFDVRWLFQFHKVRLKGKQLHKQPLQM